MLYVVVDAHFLSKIRTTVKPLFTRFFDLTPYLVSAHCHTDSLMSVNLSINQSVCLYLVSYPFILDGSRPNVRCKEKKKKWRKNLEMHFDGSSIAKQVKLLLFPNHSTFVFPSSFLIFGQSHFCFRLFQWPKRCFTMMFTLFLKVF